MWTVNIKETGINNEAITAVVEFVNGDEVITRNLAGNTKAEIDGRIERQLKALETRDAEKDLVTEGEWTAPVVEEPTLTPEQAAAKAWVTQWRKYVKAKQGMDALSEAGITPAQEETDAFDALKTWVAENRKPEYTYLI